VNINPVHDLIADRMFAAMMTQIVTAIKVFATNRGTKSNFAAMTAQSMALRATEQERFPKFRKSGVHSGQKNDFPNFRSDSKSISIF
jgi:hypothetical protein